MKRFLTVRELAKLRKVSISYIGRLCRLPESDPRHIKSVKLNPRFYVIIDKKILDEYPGKYSSDV
jgi:hypothetical protein